MILAAFQLLHQNSFLLLFAILLHVILGCPTFRIPSSQCCSVWTLPPMFEILQIYLIDIQVL